MDYRSRTAEYPDYGVSIPVEEPVSQVWEDSDGFWIMTDNAPDMMEAEQMPEYLDDEPVTVETGEVLAILGDENYTVPGSSRFGFLPRRSRFALYVTDFGSLGNRSDYEGGKDVGIANFPEPRLLNYSDMYNISEFVLKEVMDVKLEEGLDINFLDIMQFRDRWEDLVSGSG